ncbi:MULTISPECIES: TMEM143 family protein [unclassified Colwellia]|jgi:hypothetical protein|uniref:TMEM143 family protein n=1 Tax=unclassified Colwellia TaxID=196834 RepID=UPI000D396D26|nr:MULTISPECIES: TMEM143 family protein [unclassified Colwellia]AWB56187.1 DUF3754 domain-containing protein [Colwellia sp. Arc7-D]MBA6415777.1 DUF3754 domain-containing protein [Colwellia sp. 6M3]|tara:strand:+ start:3106 stop:4341 length:1236 start_codon:yes stop_codon:yes gene_type:complete
MAADRFIPYRKQDIIEMCLRELQLDDSELSFRQFSDLLSNSLHVEYHQTLESLKNDYAPFDPNADTKQLDPYTTEQKADCQASFANNFASVLNAANFEKITEQDLQDALTEESLFKVRLEVEFDDFEQVVFYRRGESQLTETITSLFGLRKQTINFTNYDRVAIFITFKDKAHFDAKKKTLFGFEPGSTIVKLFQNVPKADLEMLFPNSEVRMRPIDKAFIGASAVVGGAVVLVTKLGASILLLAALMGFWIGWREEAVEMTQQHFISFAIGLGVFAGFIFKEWSKFKNRKIKFMKALSDNLYFKNLDNNAGVFHTLIDAAEEEDFKEAILAYSFLLNNKDGLTAEALDEKIEYWFKVKYQCELDFEIVDALSKLERMELVELNNNVYQAIALDEAKIILDTHWDNIFNYA